MGTLRRTSATAGECWLKTPALTAVVAITLALGIGANTLIFSFVNGFLLRPMPVPHPEQIAVLAAEPEGQFPIAVYSFSYPDFVDFRKQAGSFADLVGYILALPGLSADGRADQVLASFVTGNYFSVLGVKPALGRLIAGSEENQPGEQPVLVLGYSYWQKRFGGDPGVIGKQVRVNGKQATIIGVVPKQFLGAIAVTEMDMYLPLSNCASIEQASSNPCDGSQCSSGSCPGQTETRRQFRASPSIRRRDRVASGETVSLDATATSVFACTASGWRAPSLWRTTWWR